MTICNMTIEWGARAGMIAPDETTFAYLEGREHAPQGDDWERALEDWRIARAPIPDAAYDAHVVVDVTRARPAGDLGHEPGHGRARRRRRARSRRRSTTPTTAPPPSARSRTWISGPGQRIDEIAIDRVFIGSCTNSRIEDLRAAAAIVAGRTVDPRVTALVVPGSAQVRRQARGGGPRPDLPRRGLRVASRRAARCASG